jgi:DeoR/GlpR family transcriptional regulator of sugar metabolism
MIFLSVISTDCFGVILQDMSGIILHKSTTLFLLIQALGKFYKLIFYIHNITTIHYSYNKKGPIEIGPVSVDTLSV